MISVSETTAKLTADRAPKATLVVPVKPVPVMVTVVPPAVGPEFGVTAVTDGADATKVNESAGPDAALVPPRVVVTRTGRVPNG